MIKIAKDLKVLLSDIHGINTVKIGLEPNITPKDYPLIRIVPVESSPTNDISGTTKTTMTVYVGIADKFDKDGLELVYETLEVFETEIKSRFKTSPDSTFIWRSTRQDEDRLSNVKVIAMQVDGEG